MCEEDREVDRGRVSMRSYEVSANYCFLSVHFYMFSQKIQKETSLSLSLSSSCMQLWTCVPLRRKNVWGNGKRLPDGRPTWPCSAAVWKRSDSHTCTPTHAKNTAKHVHNIVHLYSVCAHTHINTVALCSIHGCLIFQFISGLIR